MGARSFARSSVATTFARAAPDTGFKNCCLRSGRYDGSRKNHFFPRVIARSALAVSKHFLRAEGHGLSLLTTTPTFTNLSAVQTTQSCRELAAHHMKGGHHGYQLRKNL